MTEFITGDHADYRKSEAMAELAIKWAQERRWRLEVSQVDHYLLTPTKEVMISPVSVSLSVNGITQNYC